MPETLDFSGLTDAQEWLILFQGWRIGQRYTDGSPWPQPEKRTVKKLIERGLLTEHKVSTGGLVISEYHVPIHVHAAYCLQCEGAHG